MKDYQKRIEILREEFDDLFPKDQEAIDGIRPSKSNRSAALVLWAEWNRIANIAFNEGLDMGCNNLII